MTSDSRSSLFQQFYPDIVRYYVLDGLKLDEMKEKLERREPGLELR